MSTGSLVPIAYRFGQAYEEERCPVEGDGPEDSPMDAEVAATWRSIKDKLEQDAALAETLRSAFPAMKAKVRRICITIHQYLLTFTANL